jgi:RNA polymerase sigma-54 factor
LTPQLQQSIRMLQLSTLELEGEISQALSENPLLERDDGPRQEDTPAGSDETPEPAAESLNSAEADGFDEFRDGADVHRSEGRGAITGDDEYEKPETAHADTLAEHLLRQLRMTRANARDVALTGLLIEELDDSGYLASPLTEILSWLPPEIEADLDELQAALALLQSFDPVGVGAASVSECLCLQLRRPDLDRMPEARDPEVLACARAVCANHLPLLAAGNMSRLKEAAGRDETTLRAAHALIRRLDPRPGHAFNVPAADFAVPDVIVRRSRQGWQVSLNSAAVPKLRINAMYAQILGKQRESAHSDLHAQLQQARWMVRNVEQRFDTILRVAQAIVQRQLAFFSEGPQAMRPLILKDIAGELGLHESTISRATAHKYMLTPFGTLEMKHFFGAGVAGGAPGGDAASATSVQAHIREILGEENAGKPLSDNALTKKLAERGIVVARRTVAKYRESLRIAPASRRKAHAISR